MKTGCGIHWVYWVSLLYSAGLGSCHEFGFEIIWRGSHINLLIVPGSDMKNPLPKEQNTCYLLWPSLSQTTGLLCLCLILALGRSNVQYGLMQSRLVILGSKCRVLAAPVGIHICLLQTLICPSSVFLM